MIVSSHIKLKEATYSQAAQEQAEQFWKTLFFFWEEDSKV